MVEQTIASTQIEFIRPVIRQAVRTDLLAMEWGGEFRHFRIIYANAYSRMQQGTSVIWWLKLNCMD